MAHSTGSASLLPPAALIIPAHHRHSRCRRVLWPEAKDRGPGSHRLCGRCNMIERTQIDITLEIDHVLERIPEIHPLPAIEFRALGMIQTNIGLIGDQAQQEPDLLLTDAQRTLARAHEAPGKAVTQPAWCCSQYLDVLGAQPGFLFQLAEHRLQRRLVRPHSTLRELPAIPT